jgi:hypothetical protein
MMMKRNRRTVVEATIGCAADSRGSGVAYARVAGTTEQHLLRVPFRVEARGPHERAVGYAALTAVARVLRARGVARVRFLIDDDALLADLRGRSGVPDSLAMPYVRLRCALNQFDDAGFAPGTFGDLAQRARAEVALRVAA